MCDTAIVDTAIVDTAMSSVESRSRPCMRPTRVSLRLTADRRPLLRLEHRYAHPVPRVWEALTDTDGHSRWFGVRTEIDLRRGGGVRCWCGDNADAGRAIEGRVLEMRPPRLLVHTGRGDLFRWELGPDGDGCRLILHDTVAEPAHLPWSAAGLHGALDLLEMHLDGGDPAGVAQGEDTWFDRMVGHYTRVLRPACAPDDIR